MDSSALYCRNQTPTTSSTSLLNSNTDGNTSPAYDFCDSNYVAAFNCQEQISRSNSTNGKSLQNTRSNNASVHYRNVSNSGGISMSTTGSLASCVNNVDHCNTPKANANYINAMSIHMGTLPNHRRKLTSQEYQSRLSHNTADYRCHEDFYLSSGISAGSLGGSVMNSIIAATPSPPPSSSANIETQMLLQNNQSQHSHNYHQTPSQAIHHNHQQKLPNSGAVMQHVHPHRQQDTYSPTEATDLIDDPIRCSLALGNRRMVAGTQTHHNSNSEQAIATASLTLESQSPPIMYTVHRVVTTAQIQTAGGNTFTSSSSVSSVVSAVRNEMDVIGNVSTPVSTSLNTGDFVDVDISRCAANIVTDEIIASSLAEPLQLHNASGFGANTNNYLTITSNDVSRTVNSPTGNTSQTLANIFTNGVKATSSIARTLQNVIPTCVYLMSRIAVHMEIEGTAQCPCQVMLAAALGCEELGIANKLLAQSIFGLWMTGAFLEIQLKSHHRPYVIRGAWGSMLEKFSHGNPNEKKYDEPMIVLKRNIYFSKRDEEKIKDHRILELLYEEAKYNVLSGRYVLESVHSLMLGGIQARIELGPFNSHTHTVSFFRENQVRFLPQHVAKNSSWSWLPVSRKNSAEVRLLEQFKRVPQSATTRKLMRKYLEFCWALPFYGAAFFHGQVEQPVQGLMNLVNHKDVEVLIAVNERGIFIIDPFEYTLLLGLRYEDLSWDYAKPSAIDDPECQTCIFLQFDVIENGINISKLMQIFSKQAPMVDALISHFAETMRKRKLQGNESEQFYDEPNPIQNNGSGVLCNKPSRLTLATFDEEGRCIGQMGSLSISY